MADEKSPAVEALEQEQAAQARAGHDDGLDGALEDTFPASDPVSATVTSIPAVAPETAASVAQNEGDAPLVDQALAATRGQPRQPLEPSIAPLEELTALRRELAHLRDGLSEIGSASIRIVAAEATDVGDSMRARVRARPLASIGIAAALGYLIGLRH